MKAKILVVDDEAHNLSIISDYLLDADADYEVMEAINGKEALAVIEKEKILFDLILTDWNMPVMDGLALLKALKSQELYQNIPIIMQTANTEDNQLKQAFEAGAVDYIKKPISQLELLARVRSALELAQAKQKTEELLLNILPKEVAEELKESGIAKPRYYEMVSVLFTDFRGFTSIAAKLSPEEVINNLHECFLAFDRICEKHNLEKIKTIGDSYMCAGGLPSPNTSNPVDCVSAALEMQAWMGNWKLDKEAKNEMAWEMRIGIHSGDIIAGVVGNKKFAYDIWGDTVNLASRMESTGEAGKVNISKTTYDLVKHLFDCEYRGLIQIKNREEVEAYFVNGLK